MANFGERVKKGWWPAIPDPETAKKVAKNGAWAAFFCTVATMGMVLIKAATSTAYLDAALFAVLGLVILRMSRAAAVTATLLFVVERVNAGIVHNLHAAVGPVAIAVFFGFLNGIRGTFAFHRMKVRGAKQPPEHDPMEPFPVQ